MNLPTFTDDRGSLTFANENTAPLPFKVKRVFWVRLPPMAERGGHYHKKCWQAMVALDGVVELRIDNASLLLDGQSEIYSLPPFTCIKYRNVSTHQDAIVLVFCSEYYDEKDVFECQQEKK
jgi:hypothetical protein